MSTSHPPNIDVFAAAPLGTVPVAFLPKYQLPMLVSFPSCVSIAAFGPTLETSLRKEPKYE